MNLQVSTGNPLHVIDIVDNPAEYAERMVNPTIKVVRTLRNDPIAVMFAKHQIDHAQYEAARRWQRDNEWAGPTIRSSGFLQEPVDGGGGKAQDIAQRQLDAHKRLIHYATVLGPRQHQLLVLVLDRGLSAWGATAAMFPGDFGAERKRFVATWLREILSILAREMRLA
jgi:hypothetical protein